MDASNYLSRAAYLMNERATERDHDDGERSMERCVGAFNTMTGHRLSVEDGWQFMVYLKHSRMQGGARNQDDYEDAVAYSALMAESSTPDVKDVPDMPQKSPKQGVYWVPEMKQYVGEEDFEALGIPGMLIADPRRPHTPTK